MFLSVNIWSIHPLPFLKPACSCLSLVSIALSILSNRIRQKILPGIERSVMPLQLSHILLSPFFGSLTISPFAQSFGMVSLCHILWKSTQSTSVVVVVSALSISAWMLSMPGDLPFFIPRTAFLISFSVGMLRSISRSSVCGGHAGSSGSGWLRTSLKYSTHLADCSRSVVRRFPFLSIMGDELFSKDPMSCFVIL